MAFWIGKYLGYIKLYSKLLQSILFSVSFAFQHLVGESVKLQEKQFLRHQMKMEVDVTHSKCFPLGSWCEKI